MPSPKGTRPPAAGIGRKAGIPNKATKATRELFAAFMDCNAERLQALWDSLASEDPGKALEIFARFAEFVVPKLARTEVTGLNGEPIEYRDVNTLTDQQLLELVAAGADAGRGGTGDSDSETRAPGADPVH